MLVLANSANGKHKQDMDNSTGSCWDQGVSQREYSGVGTKEKTRMRGYVICTCEIAK